MISNITKISLVIILTILPVIVLSQNYARIDSIVRIYPEDFKMPQQLANKIEEDFSTQIEKARAMFTWIAENIEYDVSGINKTDKFSYRTDLTVKEYTNEYSKWMLKLAKKTLRKGKGVCRHYANLYAITAFYCGIDCYIIEGRAKTPETFG